MSGFSRWNCSTAAVHAARGAGSVLFAFTTSVSAPAVVDASRREPRRTARLASIVAFP